MTNYRIISTMKNGGHIITRGAKDMVAHFVTEFRKAQKSGFRKFDEQLRMDMADVESARIINEYTRELYLAL